MLTLRDYQQIGLNTIKTASRVKDNILTVMPCAAGKTVLMAALSDWVATAGKRVLVLMDRQNLVLQTDARFREYYPQYDILGSKLGIACKTVSERIDYDADILIASRQTLASRIAELLRTGKIKPFNAIIIDEVHNCPIINNNSVAKKSFTTEKSIGPEKSVFEGISEVKPLTDNDSRWVPSTKLILPNSAELKHPPSDLETLQSLADFLSESTLRKIRIVQASENPHHKGVGIPYPPLESDVQNHTSEQFVGLSHNSVVAKNAHTEKISGINNPVIDSNYQDKPLIAIDISAGSTLAKTDEKSDTENPVSEQNQIDRIMGLSHDLKPPSDMGEFQAIADSLYKSIVQKTHIAYPEENPDNLGLNSCISNTSSRKKNSKQPENQYHVIIQALREAHPATRIFGFTATPYRFSGEIYGKDKLFEKIDFLKKTSELLEIKELIPLKWKVSQSDISDKLKSVKRSSTGELNEFAHQEILTQPCYLKEVLRAYQEHCTDRKTVIFALNIAHAEMLGEVFREANIRTWVLHSKNELKTDEVVKEFERSEGVLINVGKLTIGSDIPCIRAIILARRVMSTALFFQMVGRGARKYPNKTDCLILDMTGNCLITGGGHGNDPDNPIINITGREGKVKKDPPIKLCPMCDSIVPRNVRICPECKKFEWTPDECVVKELKETKKSVNLVDYEGGKVTLDIFKIELKLHESLKKLQSVRVDFYYDRKKYVSAWYFPERESKFLRDESSRAWIALGGKYATPKTNSEWIDRRDELKQTCKISVDLSGDFPKIRKIV